MSAELVQLPAHDLSDIPRRLRMIADNIEAGEYGDCHTLAWVMDCGDGDIRLGLLGTAPEYGPTAHLLFGIAQHKIAAGGIKP